MNTQPDKTKSEQSGKGQHGKKTTQQSSSRAQQPSQSAQQPSLNTLFLGVSAQQSNTQAASKSSQQVGARAQMPQQSNVRTQVRSMSTQQPSISSQQAGMRTTQLRSVGTQQSGMSSQQSSMRTQQSSAQQPSMSSQQTSTSIQQTSVSTQLPTMSSQQAAMSFLQASTSTQQPGTSSQQPGMSSQQPSGSSQQPSVSTHQMNLSTQQINMLNQMNLHGHPITIMSAQPIGMNVNQPMSLNSQQLAMSMNPQLMNLNLHAQPIPMSMNTQHMLNMHAPHLNIQAQQLNIAHQPMNMSAQHLNLHPQLGMTAQQYNMYQMRLHQMGPHMYLNPQLAAGSSQHLNMQPGLLGAQHATGEEVPMQPPSEPVDREKVCQWLVEINDPATRENALIELGKRREDIPDLAVMIWHGFGTAAALLQEIMSIYSAINPAVLSAAQSNRVCNALALLQCVAAHPETRPLFITAQFPLFLYPFLHTISKNRPFEYLRLTCLGVIGALVKNDEPEVIQYLLDTEIIPLCLRVMECGSELSKIVATFILQKILANEKGLNYICETYERFSHIAMILGKLVLTLAAYPSARLLKHIVRCYLRLSEHPRAKEALRQCLPDQLADTTFHECLQDDPATRSWIAELLVNLEMPPKSYYDPRLLSRSSTATTPH